MTREEAINKVRWVLFGLVVDKDIREAFEMLIPELRESEDERIIQFFAELATDACGGPGQEYYEELGLNYDKVMAWLEKQKEQKPIEDVAKDITKNKESATKFLKSAGIMDDNGELAKMYRSEQKPAEWSEEDEKILDSLIRLYSIEYSEYVCPWANGTFTYGDVVNFLKSLRPQWKPSEEQMKGLGFFLDYHRSQRNAGTTNWREYDAVESLYKQLKKL